MRKFLLVITVSLCLFAATSHAFWTGDGDGTSWGDVANWSETVVPLTSGGATATFIDAYDGTTTVNLDAATADTLVDGTAANFLSTRASSGGSLTFNADWGNGYANNGIWVGQYTAAGTVNFNSNAGDLRLNGAQGTYVGREASSGSDVNLNINGGSVEIKYAYIGGHPSSFGDMSLNVTGGAVYLGRDAAGTITNGRLMTGAYGSGDTSTVSISGDATVVVNDWRMGYVSDGQGTDVVEIIGSNATISYDHNYQTKQNAAWAGQTIIKFVADANGVSAINAYDADATLRITADSTALIVDVTNYQGTEDLVLYNYNRYSFFEFGSVEIIGGNPDMLYTLVYENTTGGYDNTNIGRIYISICSSTADLTGDCFVDLKDFAILASNWLACNAADCL